MMGLVLLQDAGLVQSNPGLTVATLRRAGMHILCALRVQHRTLNALMHHTGEEFYPTLLP
jgi:hypothetical protein